MRFAIFHAVCALWVLWRFWLPMNAPRVVKVAGFVVTLLIAAFPAVTATFFGGLVSPELPAWVLAAGNGCVFALTVLAGLTLLREVVIFLSVLAGRSGERMHRFVQKDRRVAIGMTAAVVGISAFGLRQGLRVPCVKEMTVPIEDLPAGLEGMRIVQLSDLHASALLRAPHMKDLVARVNSLSPDLVVITGDLVDGEVDVRSEDVAPLAELRARHGVIAVEGNHEHYLDYEGWMHKASEKRVEGRRAQRGHPCRGRRDGSLGKALRTRAARSHQGLCGRTRKRTENSSFPSAQARPKVRRGCAF